MMRLRNLKQIGYGVQGFNKNRKNKFRYCGNEHPGCRMHKFDPISNKYIYKAMDPQSKSKAKCGHFGCRNKKHQLKKSKISAAGMKKRIKGRDKKVLRKNRRKYLKKYMSNNREGEVIFNDQETNTSSRIKYKTNLSASAA